MHFLEVIIITKDEAIEELSRLYSGEAYDTEYIDPECFKIAILAIKESKRNESYILK